MGFRFGLSFDILIEQFENFMSNNKQLIITWTWIRVNFLAFDVTTQ